MTRWIDPSGRQPGTFEEYQAAQPHPPTSVSRVATPKARGPAAPAVLNVLVLVNSGIYPEIEEGIAGYVTDLQGAGYSPELVIGTFASATDLRNYLIEQRDAGVVGACLVGNFPAAWYEMGTGSDYEEFPADIYLMDLDGTFGDADADGRFDSHTGDTDLDIWVGRVMADNLTIGDTTEAALLNNYFAKNHAYRAGDLTLPDRALVYIDDDWYNEADSWDAAVGFSYPTRTFIKDKETTRGPDYLVRLSDQYQWVQVAAHSSSTMHGFKYNNGASWDYVYGSNIISNDPDAFFYNLFACSAARFTDSNCLAAWYSMCNTYALGVVGSSKTGGMLMFGNFYNWVRDGCTLGASFNNWYNTPLGETLIIGDYLPTWFYGMNVMGDPFLTPRPAGPPSVTSISPHGGADDGNVEVTLSGTGFTRGSKVSLTLDSPASRIDPVHFQYIDPTELRCIFDLTSQPVGVWDMNVLNPDLQTDTLPGCFTIEHAAPAVNSVTPARGDNDGPVSITDLAGANFREGATVKLTRSGQADVDATEVSVVSSTRITCAFDLDGKAAGRWDVVVTNDDGKSGTLTDGFTIEHPAPEVSSITPDVSGNDGPVSITDLAGVNFREGATVKLTRNGETDIDATSVDVVSTTQITCAFDLDGKATGEWDVVVTNEDGKSGTLTDGFTIEHPAPEVSSITPSIGDNDGPVSITDLAGLGFRSGATVRLTGSGQADIDATEVSVMSSTQITCAFDLDGKAAGEWNVVVANDDGKCGTLSDGFTIEHPAPEVSSITPDRGPNMGDLKITDLAGDHFTAGASVKLGYRNGAVIHARSVDVISASRITCTLPLTGAAPGAWDVTVSNPDGRTGTLKGGFTINEEAKPGPAEFSTYYLAEGSTSWGFDTFVTIQNPNDRAVTASVTYQTANGARPRPDVTLPARSQTVINPRDDIGASDFSTKVTCREDKTIAVDRRMVWQAPDAASAEGHSSIGVTAPAKTWYLAEGSSKWGFETWLLIQNPNPRDATCTVTYMIEGQGPVPVTKKVPANSRSSFNMADDIGEQDASIKVHSDLEVIGERAMYRNDRREGHDSIGATTPARNFYLAEGTTNWGFTTYVLVQNPGGIKNTVRITCMTPDGPVRQNPFTMEPSSRQTVNVNELVPGKDLSIHVEGTAPLIAERAMYWDNGTGEACHDSIGMDSPHTVFYLPDGETGGGYETWTLVQNPSGSQVTVRISYMTTDGTGNVTFEDSLPPGSRRSYNMADRVPAGRAGVMVECRTVGKKIMVERAMYWNGRGAGTNTIGAYRD